MSTSYTPVVRPKLACPQNAVHLAHDFADLLIKVLNNRLVVSEMGWSDLARWPDGNDAPVVVIFVVALLARWTASDIDLVTRRTPQDPARARLPPSERLKSYGAPSIETWVVRNEAASSQEDCSMLEMDLVAQLTVGAPLRVRDLIERLAIPTTPKPPSGVQGWFSTRQATPPSDERWFPKAPWASANLRASVRLQRFLEVAQWLVAVETGSDLGLTYDSIGRQEEEAIDLRGDALWALQWDVLRALRG